ncbi:BMP family ABC transporter substrate-binding protein [Konateibacter massiliensis]|uniref:BMP family ABC transporter substrate-binding protein n=1 Tax=Konateibacter massiliensis TaxID=2002841 RepID=UPI000C14802E|nr:BMP family ABC transporter substrate-binding protein [Konateibacter massiliensis]
MKKKMLSLLLGLTMTATLLAGCGSAAEEGSAGTDAAKTEGTAAGAVDASAVKVGIIYIGDENEGYTESHMKGIDEMQKALGIEDSQVIEKTNIPEDESAYDAAVDLADQGCNIIFATSFGQESYLIQAASEYPEIQFCHATGYQAASSGLSNMHNYFTSIYEARYVSGVVAGLKLNAMIEDGTITADAAKIGYVGAFPYAEVVSGYTSFYLGAKSVCPTVTMDVQYTNSWGNMSAEAEVASQLIANGCVLIGQHADTTGAPSTAETAGIPCVGYNVDMTTVAPNSALISAYNNWGPYYTYAVQSVLEGTAMSTDWCQGYNEDAVGTTAINEAVAAEGSADKVEEIKAAIKDGSLHVFDTSTFTVNGSSIEDLIANDTEFAKYADYVKDGYYHESELASVPSFDLRIDGITELTE